MKTFNLIVLALLVLTACTKEEASNTEKFNLINVSGGFAGVNENFEPGDIIWILNENSSTLTIEKNINGSFTGLNAGSYSYYIESIDNKLYINIDNNETGGLIKSANSMLIDENLSSQGSRADGFIYQLEK